MLTRFSRLVPRVSRTLCTAANSKEIENAKRVEEELYGRYYGETDPGNLKRNRWERRYKPKTNAVAPKEQNTPKKPQKPNPWGLIRLPLHDPVVGKLVLSARNQKRGSNKIPSIICEGERLVQEALMSGLKSQAIFVTEEDMLQPLERFRNEILKSSCSIYKVAPKDLSTWSCLTTSPGIMAIMERPTVEPSKKSLPITVVCDNIREPNNLGSIFRVCAALPCRQVMVMKGCADPWDSKCLRGASGGQFHIPIEYPVQWAELEEVTSAAKVFLADNKSKNRAVPLLSIDEDLVPADSQKNLIIVIGGETHGISSEAYEFAAKAQGSVVTIPMADKIESLNTASALAIILFELRRQIKQG